MRVYIPVTFIALRRAQSSGVLPSSGWRAYPLHPAGGDQDGDAAEYQALRAAADDSLAELRSEPEAPRRRAVVVASIPDEWAESEPDGRVELTRRIPLERLLAVYADSAESSGAVVAALNGKESAIKDMDLLWYARQELGDLVR